MSRALGRYELLRPLARGGMGEVYLARRRAAGVEKWLVVKRMRPERVGDSRFLDLFMREARLSMSLTHQNIVPVFDFGRMDDQVFLAMERVEGKDLGSTLQKAGKGLPELLAAFVAAECLQALDYAHRRKGPDGAELGIVHRDVTPRNVLLSWSGEVKLTDFGIAALAGDSHSRTAGTPAYMAPEQARGETLDVRADVYAVGLVLRESLLGERARRGNDRETVLEIAKQGALDPWPDGLDSPLRTIVERATAPGREDRYADAREMLEELDTFIVDARAAHKGDPPSRQLATWLAEVWKDTRDDEALTDAQIEAGVMVSFLDDGPLDVIGTGTQRSALVTAGDSAASQPAAPDTAPTETPGPSTKVEVDDPALASPAPGAGRARSGTEAIADDAASRRGKPLVVAIAVVALVALGVWRFAGTERGAAGHPVDASIAIAEPSADAAVLVAEAPVDAPAVIEEADAAVVAAAPDAAVVEPRPRPRPMATPRDPKTGSATPKTRSATGSAAEVAPVAGTRKVTINSRPWSNWTVDGGAQHAGLDTVELTPGPHTIHFTGNPYFKSDKKVTIVVPDRDGFTHVETLEPAAPPAP